MNEVATFQPPRLPYHPEIHKRYGVDKSGWKALTEAIYPSAKSVDSIVMALSYCQARRLDPFKRPVHIVPMWDAARRVEVETVWPGISELRTTAFRTGQYAGCDEAEFGPEMTKTFRGTVGKRGYERDVEETVTFPEWCRMTVHRDLNGRICKFVGPKVRWLESYATQGGSEVPNSMWASRPIGQLEKCAEAAALRKAFPEEIGNSLTAEEMEGRHIASQEAFEIPAQPRERTIDGSALDVFAAMGGGESQPEKPAAPQFADPAHKAAFDAQAPTDHDPETGEVVEDAPGTVDIDKLLEDLEGKFAEARDEADLLQAWADHAEPRRDSVFPGHWERVEKLYARHETRLGL